MRWPFRLFLSRGEYQVDSLGMSASSCHSFPPVDDAFSVPDDQLNGSAANMLTGEDTVHQGPGKLLTRHGICRGEILVTNYRFQFTAKNDQPDDVKTSFSFPLGFINGVEKFGKSGIARGENSYGVKISCKDMRTVKFIFDKTSHGRRAFFDILVANAFPNTNQKPFFAKVYKEPFKSNGWLLYDPVSEFSRMGIPNNDWLITDLNKEYNFIPTYPSVLVLPRTALEKGKDFLEKVADFRSSRRIPVLCWHDPKTGASITRSSQPMPGMTMRTSAEDELYLELVFRSHPSQLPSVLKIFDARPTSNAQANRLRGGGYETSYAHCKLVFLNIHSIHAIRSSSKSFKSICYPKTVPEKKLSGASESKWVSHLQAILNGTHLIITELLDASSNVLVHCSDGWDRTSQLTSLTMLCLDPYYRSLEGFAILIEKEWLSFGHKFAIRFGHGVDNPKSEERSPIFVQWVDCVWQHLVEFKTAFEFNEHLLLTILEEVLSCRFGTFLCNNERERSQHNLKGTTTSFWSYVLDNRERFINPDYRVLNSALRTTEPLKVRLWLDYYCQHRPDLPVLRKSSDVGINKEKNGASIITAPPRPPLPTITRV